MHRKPLTLMIALAGWLALPVDAADIDTTSGILYERAKRQPGNREERLKLNATIVAEGLQCLAANPDVPRTATKSEILVRRVILPAAERVHADAPTAQNREQLRQLADQVVRLPVYEGHEMVPEKPHAGYVRARLAIYPTPDAQPQDAAKHIRDLIAAFPVRPELKEPEALHGQAIVYAAQLAIETGEQALADELCKIIAAKFVGAVQALNVLAQAGQPAVFTGELTTLDGQRLTFPQDAKGQVVLLDFWATWCGPCRAALPHLKQLHEKYRDRGVWIVGVSCDVADEDGTREQVRQKVVEFVATNGCTWTQTYAGEWPKVATKYGVIKLPKVFLLDKQGRILSTTARGREEELITQALAAP